MWRRTCTAVLYCLLGASSAGAAELSAKDRQVLASQPAGPIYRGQPHLPDFRGRDRNFASFRTRIADGIRGGANFAGNLAMIVFGCGAGCRSVYVADVSTGRVDSFPLGGEDNMYLDLNYRADSRAVVAYWQDTEKQRCIREVLVWQNGAFRKTDTADVGSSQICP